MTGVGFLESRSAAVAILRRSCCRRVGWMSAAGVVGVGAVVVGGAGGAVDR